MTQDERLISMQSWLLEQKKITLSEVCERYGISRDSARRDLVKLTQQPGVQRVRGGAICVPVSPDSKAYHQKSISQVKLDIGRVAASLVEPHDYILMDTGTTLSAMASYLTPPLTVVTNAVDCLTSLSQKQGIDLHFVGGKFNGFHRAMLGATAIQQLSQYRLNKAFIGVCALSEHGLSTTSEEEASMKQAMIEQAQLVVLVCDSSKFGQQHFFKVCEMEKVDIIVTDQRPSSPLRDIIESNDIHLIVTNQPRES
ncbi:DeoR/GlpR family DNA-binding transcription regulator [Vibrio sp. Of7-15]|uniref:DeoR/GlpR family DNA-binding transcription regulator n=1 Tax=Vibrio sp. Of7-15 TaxID=2724879 RepID=UPI001EF2EC2F|nr:DeoR/GlpR family DNA-binding transcription regulator [Vibrio sp. Of7-15]MCG7498315.1 DeoR/GlpR family DNA-binding transcription regulator [Vibrio sp. Of7-15]